MKKLPLADKPYVRTYTYHAYMNAIMQKSSSNILAKITFPEESYTNLEIKNEKIQIIDENDEIVIIKHPYEKHNYCSFYRKGKKNDSLIIEIKYQKYTHQWGNIQLFITCNDNTFINDSYIYAFGNFCGNGLFVKNYKEFCNINKLGPDDIKYPIYLKLELSENKVFFSYSYDKHQWNLCYGNILNEELPDNFYLGAKIELNDVFYDWLFSNYIQLEIDKGWIEVPDIISIDYFVTPKKNYTPYTIHNLLDFKYDEPKMILRRYTNILDYIIHHIDYNYYIELKLNEKYIQNRLSTDQFDQNHENLVYGYDEDRKILYIMGIDKIGKPELSEISFETFNLAFYTSDLNERIYLIKYITDSVEYKLNTRFIISSLEDYINGKNSSKYYENLFKPTENIYGILVYDEIMRNDKTIDLFFHDVRISYLLLEHKKLMKERINFFITRGIISSDATELVNYIDKICLNAEYINKFVIKYKLNHDNNIKSKVIKLLKEIKELEKICYPILIDLLASHQE